VVALVNKDSHSAFAKTLPERLPIVEHPEQSVKDDERIPGTDGFVVELHVAKVKRGFGESCEADCLPKE